MGGFYKFRESDVENLAVLLDNLPASTRGRRTRMVLHCLANVREKGDWCPVPFFSLGVRTLAKLTEETPASVQRFYAQMERDGWFVRVGEVRNHGGLWTLRSFFWMAEGVSLDEEKPIQGVYRANDTPLPESPAKTDTGVYRCARKNRYTSDIPEGMSDMGGSPADAGTPPTVRDTLAEIISARERGEEPEWLR